ncbi:SDR family NAD(P)-dependent oxidoreductase [Aliarcobacter butzleri]|uniref:SDR family NAD(P)-dependent oxidoreductase n=1 Tax=Aliarcobacter butzleri TaxID=28197 RepID=UPI0012FB4098|nr:SDR family oxidoreductase [Aliarcobacter butzleri]
MKKNILISGVTSGMGLVFYELLDKNKYNIYPLLRKKSNKNLDFYYENMIEVDFSKPQDIEEIFSKINIKFDAFINFAGILPGKSIFEQDYNGLKELFDINVLSPMLIIKSIQLKLNKNAVIVLLGSISAQKGSYDDPYSASKGAIHSLVKSVSLKFAPNIRVVGIAPGITDNTGMTNNLVDGLYEQNIQKVPLNCAAQPEDIAELILFIIEKHAKFMTGCVIDINGGQYLR